MKEYPVGLHHLLTNDPRRERVVQYDGKILAMCLILRADKRAQGFVPDISGDVYPPEYEPTCPGENIPHWLACAFRRVAQHFDTLVSYRTGTVDPYFGDNEMTRWVEICVTGFDQIASPSRVVATIAQLFAGEERRLR
jgi:hypothetical protein